MWLSVEVQEKICESEGGRNQIFGFGVGIWLSTELLEKIRAGEQGRNQFFGFRGRIGG